MPFTKIDKFFDPKKTVEQQAYDLLLRESTITLFEKQFGKIKETSVSKNGIIHFHSDGKITTECKVDDALFIQV